MTAILKVDTIQDTAGNNIINESSNTITIGASGDTISIPSGATITNSGTATGFGSMIKLQTQTASSSSNITFSSTYITTTYKRYELHWSDVVISSDGGNISSVVSVDNGSNYVTSGYKYRREFSASDTANNAVASGGGTTNSALVMSGSGRGMGTATDESASGTLIMFNPFSADSKLFISDAVFINDAGLVTQNLVYQALIQSATFNNLKIIPNTGTIVSGTFTLYGVTS
tara:strand:+ start:840 stop:1529 length:690 start_codon:yes stop_codon:yes gene_type:complete